MPANRTYSLESALRARPWLAEVLSTAAMLAAFSLVGHPVFALGKEILHRCSTPSKFFASLASLDDPITLGSWGVLLSLFALLAWSSRRLHVASAALSIALLTGVVLLLTVRSTLIFPVIWISAIAYFIAAAYRGKWLLYRLNHPTAPP